MSGVIRQMMNSSTYTMVLLVIGVVLINVQVWMRRAQMMTLRGILVRREYCVLQRDYP